jgi:hypothetical protein
MIEETVGLSPSDGQQWRSFCLAHTAPIPSGELMVGEARPLAPRLAQCSPAVIVTVMRSLSSPCNASLARGFRSFDRYDSTDNISLLSASGWGASLLILPHGKDGVVWSQVGCCVNSWCLGSAHWATYEEAKKLLKVVCNHSINLVKRESNNVADSLAKHARTTGSCEEGSTLYPIIWDLVTNEIPSAYTN